MQHRNTIECVDELLRKITLIDKPFGGKVLLAVGDFRQTAPIVSGAGKSDTIAASIQSSRLWTAFHILRLHAPIRNAEDIEYAEFVDAIGDGNHGYDCHSVPLDMIQGTDCIQSSIQYLYPSDVLTDPDKCIRSSFLSPLNLRVDEYNDTILDLLPGKGCTYSTTVKYFLIPLLT